jgi:5'-3' exonuclease
MSEIVLVDFSNLAHCVWHPAVAAQKAGEDALVAHKAQCASCEIGEPCTNKPRQYDAKQVLLTNLDLKLQTLSEAIVPPIKSWVFVKDGKDLSKRALFPGYKSGRPVMEFDPKPLAEAHLREKGCRFAWSSHAEADDAICTMANDLKASGMKVVVVSSDADLWALYDPPLVRIYLMTRKEWLEPAHIEKKFGFREPQFIRLSKSLWGDSSDAIPNVVPRQQKQLMPLIKASDGTLEGLESLLTQSAVSAKCWALFYGNVKQVRVNYQLVTLNAEVPIEWL